MGLLACESEIIAKSNLDGFLFSGNQSYIWVIHANKIPPHIGISSGKEFFSLKANGKDERLSIDTLISVLKKKNVAVLLYAVNYRIDSFELKEAFQRYHSTIPGRVTCLQPLKDVFQDSNAMKVAELIRNLEIKEGIKRCYGWQLPEDFIGIPDYEVEEIHDRLKQLSHAK